MVWWDVSASNLAGLLSLFVLKEFGKIGMLLSSVPLLHIWKRHVCIAIHIYGLVYVYT